METIRTFVAVDITAAVREQAARLIAALRSEGDGVKWVEPENMHLTLKFLGDVPGDQIPGVCQAVAEAAAQQTQLTLGLQGVGSFPSISRPRTVWLGVTSGREPLEALQKVVDRALRKLGYPKEGRRFEPHLTLGRIRRPGPSLRELSGRLQEQRAFDAGISPVDHVVVYASHLDRSGPTYQPLSRTALSTPEQA